MKYEDRKKVIESISFVEKVAAKIPRFSTNILELKPKYYCMVMIGRQDQARQKVLDTFQLMVVN